VATEAPLSAGLLEACDSAQLFGVDLTPRQRELLAAVEAGDLLHVWALGRRSGKTLMGVLVALWTLLLRPELREHLRRRERMYAAAVATNLRQSRITISLGLSVVEASPLLGPLVESSSEDEIRFRNRSSLVAFPCTSRGGRGWPIAALLLDEAAHMLDTDGNQAAAPIFRSLSPSVAQFGDAARILVASSPHGLDGFFAETFATVDAGDLPDATCARAATLEMRPDFATAALELERRRDPTGFAAEYEAEFVAAGGSFMDAALVQAAVGRKRELPPDELADVQAGLDLGLVVDSSGLVIMGRDRKDPNRTRVALARSWTPSPGKPLSLSETLAEVAALCHAYGVGQVYLDQYNAQGAREELGRHGIYASIVPTTPSSKSEMFADLRSRIYDGTIELRDDAQLLAEFSLLETVTTPGRATVRSRRSGGSHGDIVTALALVASKLRPFQGAGMRVAVASGRIDGQPLARSDEIRDGERRALAARFGRVFDPAMTSFARRKLRKVPGAGHANALDRELQARGISRWSVERGQADLQEIIDRAGRGK
jgi:hypothetical protein